MEHMVGSITWYANYAKRNGVPSALSWLGLLDMQQRFKQLTCFLTCTLPQIPAALDRSRHSGIEVDG